MHVHIPRLPDRGPKWLKFIRKSRGANRIGNAKEIGGIDGSEPCDRRVLFVTAGWIIPRVPDDQQEGANFADTALKAQLNSLMDEGLRILKLCL